MSIFLWDFEEAERESYEQCAMSDCGTCAIKNLMKVMFNYIMEDETYDSIKIRQRNYETKSLKVYLESRAKAGMYEHDLVEGMLHTVKVMNEKNKNKKGFEEQKVRYQFFPSKDLKSKNTNIYEFIYNYLKDGAFCITTGYVFYGQYFHHQFLFGIDLNRRKVYLTNDVEEMSDQEFEKYLLLTLQNDEFSIPMLEIDRYEVVEYILYELENKFDGDESEFLKQFKDCFVEEKLFDQLLQMMPSSSSSSSSNSNRQRNFEKTNENVSEEEEEEGENEEDYITSSNYVVKILLSLSSYSYLAYINEDDSDSFISHTTTTTSESNEMTTSSDNDDDDGTFMKKNKKKKKNEQIYEEEEENEGGEKYNCSSPSFEEYQQQQQQQQQESSSSNRTIIKTETNIKKDVVVKWEGRTGLLFFAKEGTLAYENLNNIV